MALHWPEARVVVRFEEEPREVAVDGCPRDTLVIVMSAAQARDPAFAREVRRIVAERTREAGGGTGLEDAPGEGAAALEAERSFVANLAGDEPASDEEDLLSELLEAEGLLPLECAPLAPWGAAPTVQLVVHRCDRVVVGG